MTSRDLSFTNKNGLKIYAKSYENQGKASVLILHGMSEHFHRYDALVESLLQRGFDVYGIDYRGHGRSEGERGLIEDFNFIVSDLEEFISKYDLENGEKPRFIFAHSMGGLLALHHLLKNQSSYLAVALSGALMMPGTSIPKFLVNASKPLVRMFPNRRWVKLAPKYIVKSQSARDIRAKDKQVAQGAPPNISGLRLLEAMESMKSLLGEIHIPALIMHGELDKIVNPKSAELIYNGISSKEKQREIQKDLFHEIIHEEEGPQIISRIGDYFEERLSPD